MRQWWKRRPSCWAVPAEDRFLSDRPKDVLIFSPSNRPLLLIFNQAASSAFQWGLCCSQQTVLWDVSHVAVPCALSDKSETFEKTRQRDWRSGQGVPLSQTHKFTHVIAPWGRGIQGFEHLPAEWHSIRCFFSSLQDESSHLMCPSLPSEPHQNCCLQVGAVDRTNIDFANFPKPVLQVSVKSIFGPWAQLYANQEKGFNYAWCSSCLHIQNEERVSCHLHEPPEGFWNNMHDPSAVRRQIRALNKRLNKVPERSALETAEVKWTRCKT